MKLFWKLFCSMVLITALACSAGGYVLIDAQFRGSLDREVSALYEENDLLRYALAQELTFNPQYSRRELAQAAGGIRITTSRGTVSFRLSDEGGTALGGSGKLPVETGELTAALPEGQRGWVMRALGDGRIYLHAASPLRLEDGVLYLENCREVSSLFSDRDALYQRFFMLMLILTGAVGLLSLLIASMLLRPLARLSAATRRMAGGDLSQRVEVTGDDEIAQLSADFNVMAHRIRRQVRELTGAARRQEDFIGSFAHEIKTPLTSIIGYADLLRSRPATADQVRESAGYIFSEGRRLEALSRKLLDLIVLERQDFSLRPVRLDLFLSRAAGVMGPALERAGLRLTVRAQAVPALMEPDLMESVCVNLLDNARKAMEGVEGPGKILLEGFSVSANAEALAAGGECGAVLEPGTDEECRPGSEAGADGALKTSAESGAGTEPGVSPEPGLCCIRVTDSGKGIPAEELARVTEAFYMVDKSRSRAQGGAGLGLALCRRIVELHGGRMELESTLGRGTRVTVFLKGGGPV